MPLSLARSERFELPTFELTARRSASELRPRTYTAAAPSDAAVRLSGPLSAGNIFTTINHLDPLVKREYSPAHGPSLHADRLSLARRDLVFLATPIERSDDLRDSHDDLLRGDRRSVVVRTLMTSG